METISPVTISVPLSAAPHIISSQARNCLNTHICFKRCLLLVQSIYFSASAWTSRDLASTYIVAGGKYIDCVYSSSYFCCLSEKNTNLYVCMLSIHYYYCARRAFSPSMTRSRYSIRLVLPRVHCLQCWCCSRIYS